VYEADITGIQPRLRAKKISEVEVFFQGFIDYMAERDLAPSTQRNYLAHISHVLGRLKRKLGVEISWGEVKAPDPEFAKVTLPVDFLPRYLRADLPGLDDVDATFFLLSKIQAMTCLRAGDLFSLTKENFKVVLIGDTPTPIVEVFNEKGEVLTSTPLAYPIYRLVQEQIEKYGSLFCTELQRTNRKNSLLSRYNRALKRIMAWFPELQDFKIPVQDSRGKTTEKVVRYRDVITSHTLRRAGANLYIGHVSDNVVMQMGGWKDGSPVFYEHYKKPMEVRSSHAAILAAQEKFLQ
jgi:integrase